MINWIVENKEWLFSGIGVVAIGFLAKQFYSSKGKKQIQKSGDNSTNIQIGGDYIKQGTKKKNNE